MSVIDSNKIEAMKFKENYQVIIIPLIFRVLIFVNDMVVDDAANLSIIFT